MSKVYVNGKEYSSIQEAKSQGATFKTSSSSKKTFASERTSAIMQQAGIKDRVTTIPSDVGVAPIDQPKDKVTIKSPEGQGMNVNPARAARKKLMNENVPAMGYSYSIMGEIVEPTQAMPTLKQKTETISKTPSSRASFFESWAAGFSKRSENLERFEQNKYVRKPQEWSNYLTTFGKKTPYEERSTLGKTSEMLVSMPLGGFLTFIPTTTGRVLRGAEAHSIAASSYLFYPESREGIKSELKLGAKYGFKEAKKPENILFAATGAFLPAYVNTRSPKLTPISDIKIKSFTSQELQTKSPMITEISNKGVFYKTPQSFSETFASYKAKSVAGLKYDVYEYTDTSGALLKTIKRGDNILTIEQLPGAKRATMTKISGQKVKSTKSVPIMKPLDLNLKFQSATETYKVKRRAPDYLTQYSGETYNWLLDNKKYNGEAKATIVSRLDTSAGQATEVSKTLFSGNSGELLFKKNILNELKLTNKPGEASRGATITKNVNTYEGVIQYKKITHDLSRTFWQETYTEATLKPKGRIKITGKKGQLQTDTITRQRYNILKEPRLKTETFNPKLKLFTDTKSKPMIMAITKSISGSARSQNFKVTPIQKKSTSIIFSPITQLKPAQGSTSLQISKQTPKIVPTIKPIYKQDTNKPNNPYIPNKPITVIDTPKTPGLPVLVGFRGKLRYKQGRGTGGKSFAKPKYNPSLGGLVLNLKARKRSPKTSGLAIRGL